MADDRTLTSSRAETAGSDRHRLHRDPKKVDGLQPEKADDHEPSKAADIRSDTEGQGYTTEREAYTNPAVDQPTDPDQRADGSSGGKVD